MRNIRNDLVKDLNGMKIEQSINESIISAFDQLIKTYPDKSDELNYVMVIENNCLYCTFSNFCGESSVFELKFPVDSFSGNNSTTIINVLEKLPLNLIETISWICLFVLLCISVFVIK